MKCIIQTDHGQLYFFADEEMLDEIEVCPCCKQKINEIFECLQSD